LGRSAFEETRQGCEGESVAKRKLTYLLVEVRGVSICKETA
jgi:hypothetical protein